jgi:hypothetical protein
VIKAGRILLVTGGRDCGSLFGGPSWGVWYDSPFGPQGISLRSFWGEVEAPLENETLQIDEWGIIWVSGRRFVERLPMGVFRRTARSFDEFSRVLTPAGARGARKED